MRPRTNRIMFLLWKGWAPLLRGGEPSGSPGFFLRGRMRLILQKRHGRDEGILDQSSTRIRSVPRALAHKKHHKAGVGFYGFLLLCLCLWCVVGHPQPCNKELLLFEWGRSPLHTNWTICLMHRLFSVLKKAFLSFDRLASQTCRAGPTLLNRPKI